MPQRRDAAGLCRSGRRTVSSERGTTKPPQERAMPRPGSLVSAVERAARASGRRTPTDGAVGDEVRTARAGLSAWLTAGREARGWTREHVARTTRIPMRTVENLEGGRWDELPADVFVRGFLRGYARCVGLSVDDALAQYSGCGFAAAPVASAQARALLDSMAPLAPLSAAPRAATATPITLPPRILSVRSDAPKAVRAIELAAIDLAAIELAAIELAAIELAARVQDAPLASVQLALATITLPEVAVTAPPHRRQKRAVTVGGTPERDSRGRFTRKSQEMAVVADSTAGDAAASDEPGVSFTAIPAPAPDAVREPGRDPGASLEIEIVTDPVVTRVVPPPSIRLVSTPSGSTPSGSTPSGSTPRGSMLSAIRRAAPAAPSLVIDDDDPDDAERAREQRAQQQHKDGGWRSFLPPALLDQERGGRQGGLTLAVIILLIVATLTLSYLMRRPSSTGEGVTRAVPAHVDPSRLA